MNRRTEESETEILPQFGSRTISGQRFLALRPHLAMGLRLSVKDGVDVADAFVERAERQNWKNRAMRTKLGLK